MCFYINIGASSDIYNRFPLPSLTNSLTDSVTDLCCKSVMSDHPICSTRGGGTVEATISPGWHTYISGLSRNTFNQMIRMRITEGELTNTEYLNADFGKANETMKLRRTHEGSYAIISAAKTQKLELAAF
ncbi:hypothetical protein D9619_004235 [Psilocybe cf. subviscida]|uniref:Uncharacterized protein n=1 Tax=Psilocybe cf. subviscida TaxID=2480587 RepID=A0A8H5BR85_9AGAR|nr:hypothetical protein D9619_004235 [Psilocybe cf. subviscida]